MERSSGRNDGHAGRLIRKLALVFLAFAVVAVVLNCALAYVSTRDTFLQSEAYRLGQVGGYAANATPQALPSDALQAWKDNADELDPATTYDQSLAETQGLISAYNAEVDRLKGSEEEATEEDQDRLDGMLAEYERKSIPLSLYSLDAMLDRLRASFSVSRLAVVVPDEQNETVLYVAEGISGDQKRGVDAHFFGDEEQRLKAGLPRLVGSGRNRRAQHGSRPCAGRRNVRYVRAFCRGRPDLGLRGVDGHRRAGSCSAIAGCQHGGGAFGRVRGLPDGYASAAPAAPW